MHLAAFNGHTQVIEILAAFGDDIEAQTSDEGRTPLMLAHDVPTVRCLLNLDAKTTNTAKDGFHVWHASNDEIHDLLFAHDSRSVRVNGLFEIIIIRP